MRIGNRGRLPNPTQISAAVGKASASSQMSLWSLKSTLLIICCIFGQVSEAAKGAFKCYSCMSRYYRHTWNFAGYSRIYVEPHAFTDDCKNPSATNAEVPYVYCDDYSNCIAMAEDIQIGVGARGYIRGCWSSIFLWGFNRSGDIGALRHHDFCAKFNVTELPASNTDKGRPFESKMTVCSCAGNLCNKKPFASASAAPWTAKSSLGPLIFFVFISFAFFHS